MSDMQRDNFKGAAAERFRTTHDIVGIKGEPKEDSMLRSIELDDFEQFKNGLDKLKNHLQDNPKEFEKALKELNQRLTKADERSGLIRHREQLDPETAGAQLTRLADFLQRAAQPVVPTLVGSEPPATAEAAIVIPQPHVAEKSLADPGAQKANPPVAPQAGPEETPKAEKSTEPEDLQVKEAVTVTTPQNKTPAAATAHVTLTATPPAATPETSAAPEVQTEKPAAATVVPTTAAAKASATLLPGIVTEATASALIDQYGKTLEQRIDPLFQSIVGSNLKDLPASEFKLFLESKTNSGKEILPLIAQYYSTDDKGILADVLAKQMPQAFQRATTLGQSIDRWWFNDQETFTKTLSGVGNTPEEKKQSNQELKMAWQLLRAQKLEDAISIELDPERVAFALETLNATANSDSIVQAKNDTSQDEKNSARSGLERFIPSF